jgi:hypothetical protein
MINADAVGLAAQSLGLEVNTIGDLIRSITGNHIAEMKYLLGVLNRIEQILQNECTAADDNTPLTDDDISPADDNISPTDAKYNSIQKIILHTTDEEFKEFICGRVNYTDIKHNEISIKSINEEFIVIFYT